MSSLLLTLFGQYGQRNHETTKNSQKLKTYSAPTVGNKVCDIGGHHRAITSREDTVSHHTTRGGDTLPPQVSKLHIGARSIVILSYQTI